MLLRRTISMRNIYIKAAVCAMLCLAITANITACGKKPEEINPDETTTTAQTTTVTTAQTEKATTTTTSAAKKKKESQREKGKL